MSDPRTPLAEHQVRLLKLERSTEHDSLQGELTVQSMMNDRPDYVALSYTWGAKVDRKASCTMHVRSGGQVKFSKNLLAALSRLRAKTMKDFPLLWADQICINQNNSAEKEPQISIMREIYSEAKEVWVYVGEEDRPGNAQRAHSAMTALMEYNNKLPLSIASKFCRSKNGKRRRMNDDELHPLDHILLYLEQSAQQGRHISTTASRKTEAQSQWDALLSIWKRPWFKRLWVRQEVILARKTIYHYGGFEFDSKKLERACRLQYAAIWSLFETEASPRDAATATVSMKNWLSISRAWELFDLIPKLRPRSGRRGHDLLSVLRFTATLGCGRPHDRVYSIYPLSSAATHSCFTPRYGQPLGPFWTEVAAYILKDTDTWNRRPKKAEIPCPAVVLALRAIQGGAGTTPTPSWVPDFNQLRTKATQKFDYYVKFSTRFHAGGKGSFLPMTRIVNGTLFLQMSGCLVSTISERWADTKQPPIGSLKKLLRFESRGYWASIEKDLIPWFLRCRGHAGRPIEQVLLGQGIGDRFKITKAISARKWLSTGTVDVPTFQNKFTSALSTFLADSEVDIGEILSCLLPFIRRNAWKEDVRDDTRVLARFADDRIGWVPGNAELGDQILLVGGAPFPFIVRRRADSQRYTMVGDAFIECLTDATMWETRESQERIDEFEFA